jgi:hypothetical protein
MYEDYKNNDIILKCYYYNDIYFLDNYNYLTETVIFSVLLGTFVISIFIILSCCRID